MIKKLHIYLSDSFDVYENLATEKYLLDMAEEDSLTLYLWQNQNTVVIGRNQNPRTECLCPLMDAEGVKLARRLSGGGAVFHDLGNLNFTFLCSAENYDLDRQIKVIEEACFLAGITAQKSGRNDIVADGRKFSGNAFYHADSKAYHHGTVLISADIEKMQRYLSPPRAKLEAKGVKSVRSRVVNLSELSPGLTCEKMRENMIVAAEKVYGLKSSVLDKIDIEKLASLSEEYCTWDYLYGYSAPFSFSCEGSFPWGHLQLCLQVKDGVITSVNAYTDSMDWNLPHILRSALCGCRFEMGDIEKALSSKLPCNTAKEITALFKNQDI